MAIVDQIRAELAALPPGDELALQRWFATTAQNYTPEQMAEASGYNAEDIQRAQFDAAQQYGTYVNDLRRSTDLTFDPTTPEGQRRADDIRRGWQVIKNDPIALNRAIRENAISIGDISAATGIDPSYLQSWVNLNTTATTIQPGVTFENWANQRRQDIMRDVASGLVTGPGGRTTNVPPPIPTGGGIGGGGTGGGTGGGAGGGTGGGAGGGGTGGGGIGFDGQTPTNQVSPRIQAIRDWYNANAGRTGPEAESDLSRFLATSGYSAREINQALPQFSVFDLQNAMRNAINTVAQQTPFAPAVPRAINEPYTPIAGQLFGAQGDRVQEIRDWWSANEGKADEEQLKRFLASGYTAREINQALPQIDIPDIDRAIYSARQAYPTAAYESSLSRYQAAFQPGQQYVGNVSPYSLVTQQMQQFQNPYADALANISMGGYTPSLYDVLLRDVVQPESGGGTGTGGGGAEPGTGPGGGGDAGGDGGGDGGGGDGGMSNSGEGGEGSPGGWAKGGLVDYVTGPNPPGPDDGVGMLQVGEYVIKKSSVDKYGKGLLDMINEGKIPAKKIKSLLD